MNIQQAFDFLNFWINKNTGAYYTIPELELIVDRAQMSVYQDLQPKYATSQRMKEALAPFRETFDFTPASTANDKIIINVTDEIILLDIQIQFNISNRVVYAPIKLINEDTRTSVLNSQVDPVTATSPVGVMLKNKLIELFPKINGYTGNVVYLRRPLSPIFGFTVVSGRVIVYNPSTSTQLEWNENWQNVILIKALRSIGINLSDGEVSNFAENAGQQNYQSVNMI